MARPFTQRLHSLWLGEGGSDPGAAGHKFTCGTLQYTPATLAVLFGWLLWGDFTFTLMESEPGLLVMQLKDHGISNSTMAILLGSIATICNLLLNPVISSYSDRFRSRWGRRRPFLMAATPIVTFFLVLVPWAPDITARLLQIGWARSFLEMFPAAPLVLVYGTLIVCFRVFNMFIVTVYYYLIPDTVPPAFIGRFYGLFRVVGIVAGMLFNWFVFGHAHAHMRFIFAFFGVLYAASFTVMCWKVREGGYPEIQEERGRWYSPVKNYATECFGQARYWLIFLIYGATQWAGTAGMFSLFFYRDQIGLTEQQVGRLGAVASGANLLLAVPFGTLVDRLGSQKALMIGLLAGIVVGIVCFLGIHSVMTAFVLGFAMSFPGFLIYLALGKWTVDMYPRAQYGQFGSAGAFVGAVGAAVLTPLAGRLVDTMGDYYRLCLIVPPIFYGVSLVGSILLFRMPARPDSEEAQLTVPKPTT